MTRDSQKWYDKPVSKLILITIALTWFFPIFGFVLSSFRPGESIKRTTWWDALFTGEIWSELTLQNYSEIFFADSGEITFFTPFVKSSASSPAGSGNEDHQEKSSPKDTSGKPI